jgi:hypothetical protein
MSVGRSRTIGGGDVLVKLGVFMPMRSRSTLSHNRTTASRATFFFSRWSSMPLMGLTRSSFVSVFPPTTFRNSPPIAPKLDPTSPPDAAVDASLSFLAFCADMMASISSSRSLRTNSPLLVLRPHVSCLISAMASFSEFSSRRSVCE